MTAVANQNQAPANPIVRPGHIYEAAEKSLLARLMGQSKKTIGLFEQVADLMPSDFGARKHQLIWHAMRELHTRGEAVSLLTVESELNRPLKNGSMRAIDEVTVGTLNEIASSPARDFLEAARLVRTGSLERKGAQITAEMGKVFADGSIPLESKMTLALDLIGKLATQVQALDGRGSKSIRDSIEEYWTVLESKRQALSRGDVTAYGVPSGYKAMDEVLHGFKRGKLYVVVARPSVGKSALGINLALNAMKMKQRVLFIPLEMDDQEMTARALAIESQVSGQDLDTGNISEGDIGRLIEARSRINGYETSQRFHYLQFPPLPTMRQIEAKLNQHMALYGADLIVFDQMSTEALSPEKAHTEQNIFMSETVKTLRAWAKRYNVPVVSFAQLNREGDRMPDQKPRLSHVAGSDAIGRTADVVMALHREKSAIQKEVEPTEVIFLKHRGGWEGTITLNYIPHITKFID
jgi:replicative DNA helicase